MIEKIFSRQKTKKKKKWNLKKKQDRSFLEDNVEVEQGLPFLHTLNRELEQMSVSDCEEGKGGYSKIPMSNS